jgi:hypothetical protein
MRKTREELYQLAQDYAEGKIFASWELPQQDASLLGLVFMPLFFLSEEDRTEALEEEWVAVYEYYHRAQERAVNGFPIFSSCGSLTKDELKVFKQFLIRFEEEREKLRWRILEENRKG